MSMRIKVKGQVYQEVSMRNQIIQNLNNNGACTCSGYQTFSPPPPPTNQKAWGRGYSIINSHTQTFLGRHFTPCFWYMCIWTATPWRGRERKKECVHVYVSACVCVCALVSDMIQNNHGYQYTKGCLHSQQSGTSYSYWSLWVWGVRLHGPIPDDLVYNCTGPNCTCCAWSRENKIELGWDDGIYIILDNHIHYTSLCLLFE